MARGRRPPSQSLKTFLRNHAEGIASIDFFVDPTATCKLLFGLLIISHERRQLVHVAVTANPTADWIARQIFEAFPWDTAPRYLIRDRDGAYGEVFERRVKGMGIRDRPTAPRSPWQNAYVERLIGSIRRECLDHLVIIGEAHLAPRASRLRRLLQSYPHPPVFEQRYAIGTANSAGWPDQTRPPAATLTKLCFTLPCTAPS